MRARAALASFVILVAAPAQADAEDGGASDIVVFIPGTDAGVHEAPPSEPAAASPAAPPPVAPEEPPPPAGHAPTISMSVSPRDRIALGDPITLELRAVVPNGDDVTVPPQSLAPFEIRRRAVRNEPTSDGKTAFVFRLELLCFDSGEHALGPIRLRVVTPEGLVGTTRTEPVTLRFRSLLGNEPNAQPKAPTRPVSLMEENPIPKYVAYALGTLLFGALLGWLVTKWWNRRPKPVPPPPPPRPAWEIAIERLDALRHDRHPMLEEGRVETWTDAVSDTIREYLGAMYGFDGLDMTTDEILARFRTLYVARLPATELAIFLGDSDLVKFAQASVTEEQADALLAEAYRIVRVTAPTPEAPVYGGAP